MRILSLIFFTIITLSLNFNVSFAQKKISSYVKYAETYSNLAIRHMDKYKIPASITLSQGILESGAGMSALAQKSNNHFGMFKCRWVRTV